jgi:hypothetical protein
MVSVDSPNRAFVRLGGFGLAAAQDRIIMRAVHQRAAVGFAAHGEAQALQVAHFGGVLGQAGADGVDFVVGQVGAQGDALR